MPMLCPPPCGRQPLLMALLLSSLASSAIAQDQPLAEPDEGQETVTLPEVDETALRHFARLGDQRRLEAEIARLQALHPGWVPPANPLFVDDPAKDAIQALWDLFGSGDIEGAEAVIAERRAADPAWRPPEDLVAATAETSWSR